VTKPTRAKSRVIFVRRKDDDVCSRVTLTNDEPLYTATAAAAAVAAAAAAFVLCIASAAATFPGTAFACEPHV